jgi:signal transduction histidine kinase
LFRNISRDALDVPGDALLERFTRGDSSRSTEGSGLGLSIANSLTELQGGKMSLVVDGDLFKIVLVFPFAPEP